MLFIGPLYSFIARYYATRINHFALVKMAFLATDKTILYFLCFAFLRLLWLLIVPKRRSLHSELMVWLFAFYFILVLMLTTFRGSYFPWQLEWHFDRPLSDINFIFLRETWKMVHAQSKLDFVYNSMGNVLCFLPFGFLLPAMRLRASRFWQVLLLGAAASVVIESLQFLLVSGVSDIDDVFFNSCGTALGYLFYRLAEKVRRLWQ